MSVILENYFLFYDIAIFWQAQDDLQWRRKCSTLNLQHIITVRHLFIHHRVFETSNFKPQTSSDPTPEYKYQTLRLDFFRCWH